MKFWKKKEPITAVAVPVADAPQAMAPATMEQGYVSADYPQTGGGVMMPPGGVPSKAEHHMYQLQNMGNRTFLHKVFVTISGIAALTGANNLVAQMVALTFPGNPGLEVVLRLYMMGMCVLVILTEAEWTPFVQQSMILMHWVSRGFLYTFLGVIGQNLYDVGYDNRYRNRNNRGYNRYGGGGNRNNYSNYNNNYDNRPRMPSMEDFAEWYVWLTSYLMIGVGILYIVLGALCLQNKLRQLRVEYQQGQQGQAIPAI